MTEEDLKEEEKYVKLTDNRLLMMILIEIRQTNKELQHLKSLIFYHPEIRKALNHAVKMAEKKKRKNIKIIT